MGRSELFRGAKSRLLFETTETIDFALVISKAYDRHGGSVLEQEFPNPLAFLCFRRDDPSCSGLAPFVPAALAIAPPE